MRTTIDYINHATAIVICVKPWFTAGLMKWYNEKHVPIVSTSVQSYPNIHQAFAKAVLIDDKMYSSNNSSKLQISEHFTLRTRQRCFI